MANTPKLTLIKPVYGKYTEQRDTLNGPTGTQTPDRGHLFRTHDLVSSLNKLQGKGGRRGILPIKETEQANQSYAAHVPFSDPESNKLPIYETTGTEH